MKVGLIFQISSKKLADVRNILDNNNDGRAVIDGPTVKWVSVLACLSLFGLPVFNWWFSFPSPLYSNDGVMTAKGLCDLLHNTSKRN